jgi:hypothetical protein
MALLDGLAESDAEEYRAVINDCSNMEEIAGVMKAIKSEVKA